MPQVRRSASSTITTKVVMALSGVILIGYLVAHVAGNLSIFSGPDKINSYSALLHSMPALLWGARLVLIVAAVAHIASALKLSRLKQTSRPVGYVKVRPQAATFASRTIRLGGVLLLVFVIFHILHFTTGSVHPSFAEGDVHGNVIRGLQVPGVALFYVLAMGALGLHLAHGVWSAFHTLGVTNRRAMVVRKSLAWVLAVGIAGGFVLIPLAILTGFLR